MGMKIWLDDQWDLPGTSKTAPEGWTGVENYEKLVAIVSAPDFEGIDEMSFDFHLHLGGGSDQKKNGLDAMEYLADTAKEKRDPKYWPGVIKTHTTDAECRLALIKFAQETRAKLRVMFPTATVST